MGGETALVESVGVFSFAGILYVCLVTAAGVHVVLNKRNEAAALTWLGIIVLSPYFGVVVYWLFGINRIQRRAAAELSGRPQRRPFGKSLGDARTWRHRETRWRALMRVGRAIHDAPYIAGNIVEPLTDGDEAYPAMIEAIDAAERLVVLSSYIFEYDNVGQRFVEALAAAHDRGVDVRVMIDGIGVGYGLSLVRADRMLRKRGVPTARFLATLSTSGSRFINLRNHRKILSIDGETAFIGGINIRDENLKRPGRPVGTRDLHFRVRGPVVIQIQAVFADDWEFASGEALRMPDPAPALIRSMHDRERSPRHDPVVDHTAADSRTRTSLADTKPRAEPSSESESVGAAQPAVAGRSTDSDQDSVDHARPVAARVLLDGPDDNYQKLQLTLVAAINAARERVRIVTPYFLPDRTIVHALQLAALRGVQVEVIVPAKNNLPFVDWAMQANEARLLEFGIRLVRTPPPFDHSKLFLVDREWCLIGSSNWDARSLELNFEINLECYDRALNGRLDAIVEGKLDGAQDVDLDVVRDRSLPIRLRNNFLRLFSPYL